MEQIAVYLRENEPKFGKLPVILCGDFNSFPVSSVGSIMRNQDILNENGTHWKLSDCKSKNQKPKFKKVIKAFADKNLSPVLGTLTSAYDHYSKGMDANSCNPPFTNYTLQFKATLDHIFFNERVKLTELLEVP